MKTFIDIFDKTPEKTVNFNYIDCHESNESDVWKLCEQRFSDTKFPVVVFSGVQGMVAGLFIVCNNCSSLKASALFYFSY